MKCEDGGRVLSMRMETRGGGRRVSVDGLEVMWEG